MAAHAGTINVYSEGEVDRGSTFYVEVPVTRITTDNDGDEKFQCEKKVSAKLVSPELIADLIVDDNPLTRGSNEPVPVSVHFSSVMMRSIESMLIVDDSGTNRKMMRRLLRGKCKLIDEAGDGKEAIRKIDEFYIEKSGNYDVIIMDFVMPVMSGPDCVRELRRVGYKGLIIGVTGNSMETDIATFLAAGVNKVMVKPLDYAKFMTCALGECSLQLSALCVFIYYYFNH